MVDSELDPKQRLKRLLSPTIAWLFWCAALLAMWEREILSRAISSDGDFAQHVTLGRIMLEQRGLPSTDPTLYTVGSRKFVAHEWLTEALYGALYSWLGLNGPVIVVTLLVATVLLLLWQELERTGPAVWTQLGVAACVLLLVLTHFLIRPHVVTWLFALLWQRWLTLWLEGAYTRRQFLKRALPCMVLWCNLHGGFILAFLLFGVAGFGLMLQALTEERGQRGGTLQALSSLVVGGGAVLLVSGINPFGFALHWHIADFFARSSIPSGVTEFQSPDFRAVSGKPLLIWILLSFGLALLGSSKGRLRERLLQVALLAATLQSQRNAVLFGLLTAPTVSRDLSEWTSRTATGTGIVARVLQAVRASSKRLAELNGRHDGKLWALLFLLIPLYRGFFDREYVQFSPKSQPVGAVAHIRQHPSRFQGRMLNAYGWGGYLAFTLYPEHRCFINGLADYYGPKLFDDHVKVMTIGEGFREVLAKYRVDWVIVEANSKLGRVLSLMSDWQLEYRDEVSIIYLHKIEPHAR